MHELATIAYNKARPLFEQMDIHLAVQAALAGVVPARIYVDNPTVPGAALIWVQHRFYLTGAKNNAEFDQSVRQFLFETLYPHARAAGQEAFVVYYAPNDWESVVEKILQGKRLLKATRQYYAAQENKHDWRMLLPTDFTLRLVDRALLETRDLENLEGLEREMCSERPSVQDFLDQSFGICALQDHTLAGWCLSEYNIMDSCEIGIETLPPYQKRGLATAMTCAFREHALARGVNHIGWHCWRNNAASAATALKAGFKHVTDYGAYIAWVNDA
jgi:RimJ/RimL family protein N-acetyltransferase